MVRQLTSQVGPAASELLTHGILDRKMKRMIAAVRGASFADKYGLLQGTGKVSKDLKFR